MPQSCCFGGPARPTATATRRTLPSARASACTAGGGALGVSTALAVTEAQFLRQVLDLARIYRWMAYHPALSKWSERGWPDLALVRPPRLLLAQRRAGGRRPSTRTAGSPPCGRARASRPTSGGPPTSTRSRRASASPRGPSDAPRRGPPRLGARTAAQTTVLVREQRAPRPCPRVTVEPSPRSDRRPQAGHLRRRVTSSVTKVTNRATNTATSAPTGIGITHSRVCAGADAVGIGRADGSLVRRRPQVNTVRPTGEGPRPWTVATADGRREPRCD